MEKLYGLFAEALLNQKTRHTVQKKERKRKQDQSINSVTSNLNLRFVLHFENTQKRGSSFTAEKYDDSLGWRQNSPHHNMIQESH